MESCGFIHGIGRGAPNDDADSTKAVESLNFELKTIKKDHKRMRQT